MMIGQKGNIYYVSEINPYGECLTKENCEAEEEHGHCQVCASGIRYGSLCQSITING